MTDTSHDPKPIDPTDMRYADYVNGTEYERIAYERLFNPDSVKYWYEHNRVYSVWDAEYQLRERQIARQLIIGDEYHRSGHGGHMDELTRVNCGSCVLQGYQPKYTKDEDHDMLRDGPNYAGWARVYVQSGFSIPTEWRRAFALQGLDNLAYYDAIGRDLVTWGVTFR